MAAVRTTGIRLLVLAVAGLTACQAGLPPASPSGNDRQEVTTLASSTQCGYIDRTPAARWLDTPDALEAAYRHMTRQSPGATSPPFPVPDFMHSGVLQVFMGQQSTGGFRLHLQHPRLEHSAAGISVHIEWLTPPPGALTPQVITSPCLLLGVPRGTWHSVTVLDQAGQVRAVAERR